ncbi:uncharacterized protein JCM10292_005658 [Rhodotorula paludigena]|uniref:uncharacterized protein n=1 Tax=Rhodotorula paludigena TaxID=86838 RepID=UPI003170A24E
MSTSASTTAAPSTNTPSKAPRSQFLQKLHSILENPLDSNGLRWVTDDSFEISSKDAVAIHALSPAFEFHSLSSFIRQLSYYSFRRLSDRRRSTERRNSNPGYILFSHPSGFFVRGDPSQLTKIIRKARNRPEKGGRRASECSAASDEGFPSSAPYSLPAWQPSDYRSSLGTDRPVLQLPSFGQSFNTSQPRHETTQWRAYAPATASWFDPSREDVADRYTTAPRRSSLGEFKLTPSGQATYTSSLSSLHEERPRLRKAASSLCIQTSSSLAAVGEDEQENQALYDSETVPPTGPGFRPSPYPTPTFSPTTSTFFTNATTVPPHDYVPNGATAAYSHHQPHSHLTYEPSPFAASYQPIAPPAHSGKDVASDAGAHSYHTPSPDNSPLQQVVGLPALSQTVPPSDPASHHDVDPRQLVTNSGVVGAADSSPRSSYAPLPTLQSRFGLPPSSSYSHQQLHSSQYTTSGMSDAYRAPQHAQYYPPALPHSTTQWSPAPIRTAY